jgi:HlyD family secretion protein
MVRRTIRREEDVVKVPESALFRQGEAWATFAVDGGHARPRPVRVGESNGLETVVEEGLKPGERVILHPGDAVRDGVRVEAR